MVHFQISPGRLLRVVLHTKKCHKKLTWEKNLREKLKPSLHFHVYMPGHSLREVGVSEMVGHCPHNPISEKVWRGALKPFDHLTSTTDGVYWHINPQPTTISSVCLNQIIPRVLPMLIWSLFMANPVPSMTSHPKEHLLFFSPDSKVVTSPGS